MPRDKEREKSTSVRIPISISDWIKETADKERRSFNAQLVILLERAKEQEQAENQR